MIKIFSLFIVRGKNSFIEGKVWTGSPPPMVVPKSHMKHNTVGF